MKFSNKRTLYSSSSLASKHIALPENDAEMVQSICKSSAKLIVALSLHH